MVGVEEMLTTAGSNCSARSAKLAGASRATAGSGARPIDSGASSGMARVLAIRQVRRRTKLMTEPLQAGENKEADRVDIGWRPAGLR